MSTASLFVLPFGKYSGKTLQECPETYLEFLCDYSVNFDDDEVQYSDSCADRLHELCMEKDSYINDMQTLVAAPPPRGRPENSPCAFPLDDNDNSSKEADNNTHGGHALSDLRIASDSFYVGLNAALMVSTHCASVFANEYRHEWRRYQAATGYESPAIAAQVYLWAKQPDTVKAARAYVDDKRLCRLCFRYMPPIGTARQNGSQHHADWSRRHLHKKCFRDLVNNKD